MLDNLFMNFVYMLGALVSKLN